MRRSWVCFEDLFGHMQCMWAPSSSWLDLQYKLVEVRGYLNKVNKPDPLSISTWFLKYRVSLDFFFNCKISSLKNKKINLISKLIFAGYTGSKNQVRTRQKIKFVSKAIFFRVCNKLPNWHFKNQAQIDTMIVSKTKRTKTPETLYVKL